mmetsp:Transcript_1358/g.1824  ORF Transcript_1358/g.1824 Transcript_1358/m.1824 type:complete len:154 (-) Transcript_1358:64-525(-)
MANFFKKLIRNHSTYTINRYYISDFGNRLNNTFQHFKSMGFGIGNNSSPNNNGFNIKFGGFNSGNGPSGFGGIMDWMLEHCQQSHASDIARRLNIQVNNIKFEKHNNKTVAYIDAPNATHDQVKQLESMVKNECPMARINSMAGNDDIEWKKR